MVSETRSTSTDRFREQVQWSHDHPSFSIEDGDSRSCPSSFAKAGRRRLRLGVLGTVIALDDKIFLRLAFSFSAKCDFTPFWGSKPRKQNFLKKFCFQFVSEMHIPCTNIHKHMCIFVSFQYEIYTHVCVYLRQMYTFREGIHTNLCVYLCTTGHTFSAPRKQNFLKKFCFQFRAGSAHLGAHSSSQLAARSSQLTAARSS